MKDLKGRIYDFAEFYAEHRQSHVNTIFISSDAVENFFGDPDLDPPVSPVVEKLLPYLDSASALHLLQSGITCLLEHLQYSPVIWRKLVRRTLPGDYEIGVDQLYYHKYHDRVRESFEEKQIQLASLINILKIARKFG